jgi:hypothetical protein
MIRFRILNVPLGIPPPGSPEARKQGCTCPVTENRSGAGLPVSDDRSREGFWVSEECPRHAGLAPS